MFRFSMVGHIDAKNVLCQLQLKKYYNFYIHPECKYLLKNHIGSIFPFPRSRISRPGDSGASKKVEVLTSWIEAWNYFDLLVLIS